MEKSRTEFLNTTKNTILVIYIYTNLEIKKRK